MSNNVDCVIVLRVPYDAADNAEVHFVVFGGAGAEQESAQFLGTLATTGAATIGQAQ